MQCLLYNHFIIDDCYLHLGMTYFRSHNPCRIGRIYQCQGHLYASANYNDEAMRAYEKAEQMYTKLISG